MPKVYLGGGKTGHISGEQDPFSEWLVNMLIGHWFVQKPDPPKEPEREYRPGEAVGDYWDEDRK